MRALCRGWSSDWQTGMTTQDKLQQILRLYKSVCIEKYSYFIYYLYSISGLMYTHLFVLYDHRLSSIHWPVVLPRSVFVEDDQLFDTVLSS